MPCVANGNRGLKNIKMADEMGESDFDISLPSSELGTKEYWDKTYERDLTSFTDRGDVGEIWFGEGSMKRMIKWIKNSSQINKTSSILDIGCGNGMLAIRLAESGYTNLVGLDYSASAVQLAKCIAEKNNLNIKFMECNILDLSNNPGKTFDVCLDKGTYDAISLNPEDSLKCRALYIQSLSCLLTEKALFMITSCNWTKKELVEQFKKEFSLLDEIPTPSFSFGGKSGNTVTSLIFVKKNTT